MQRLRTLAEPRSWLMGAPLVNEALERCDREFASAGCDVHRIWRGRCCLVRLSPLRRLEAHRAQAGGKLIFRCGMESAFGAQPIREALQRAVLGTGRLDLHALEACRAAMTIAA